MQVIENETAALGTAAVPKITEHIRTSSPPSVSEAVSAPVISDARDVSEIDVPVAVTKAIRDAIDAVQATEQKIAPVLAAAKKAGSIIRREIDAAKRARRELKQSHIRLGLALRDARKGWPSRGPSAAGWGKYLDNLGLNDRTARRYMKIAGFVESGSAKSDAPTYAEAGIDKRPRGGTDTVDELLASIEALLDRCSAKPNVAEISQAIEALDVGRKKLRELVAQSEV